jgi:hypothetical protein
MLCKCALDPIEVNEDLGMQWYRRGNCKHDSSINDRASLCALVAAMNAPQTFGCRGSGRSCSSTQTPPLLARYASGGT